MPQKDPSRTEAPTPKRINKARKEGNVAKSPDFTTALVLLAAICMLYGWLYFIADDLSNLFKYFFSTAILTFRPTQDDVLALLPMIAFELAKMLLPVMLGIGLTAFIVLRYQVGKLWTTKVFKPKMQRFNVAAGIKRMFISMNTLLRLGKSLLQALVIGVAPWVVINREIPDLPNLYYTDAAGLAAYILQTGFTMAIYAIIPMVLIGVVSFVYTRWDYKENLKMTKDEVKDERRQMEGDPQVKSKQRQKMFEMSQRRMMQNVPKADVILTNPTHLAVALRYNAMEAPAPVVVAKGADKVAERIKELARENRVPIRENKPLAQALYKQVELGEMIPEDLYQAVAAILAQIWKTQGRKNN